MTFAPTKRISALWVLLCWLWFSAATPFAHQCQNGDRHLPGVSSATVTCVACDWAATTTSLQVALQPVVESPAFFVQEWAAPVQATPRSVFHHLSSRGPPVLA